MHHVRLLTLLVTLPLLPGRSATAQWSVPRVEGTPSLLPGEKVRIWSTEFTIFYRPPWLSVWAARAWLEQSCPRRRPTCWRCAVQP